jgi:hypothetical protein
MSKIRRLTYCDAKKSNYIKNNKKAYGIAAISTYEIE